MTHYDPRDDEDPQDEPVSGWLIALGAVLWLAVAGSLLFQCSTAKAEVPPFLVTLPTGQTLDACGMEYDARAKALTLAPCVIVFADSFEG